MKYFLAVCFVLASGLTVNVFGQQDNYTNALKKSGNLVTVQIIPQSKQLKFFVVGKNISNFNFQSVSVEAFSRSESKLRALPVSKEKGYFLIQELPPSNDDLVLDIHHGEQSEKIEFPMKKNP